MFCVVGSKEIFFFLHSVLWYHVFLSNINNLYGFKYLAIGLISEMFTNGPGDLGSILGRAIPKTQKIELNAALPNTQNYKVSIKGKVKQSREGVVPFSRPWCCSRVTLDYGRQLYNLYGFKQLFLFNSIYLLAHSFIVSSNL